MKKRAWLFLAVGAAVILPAITAGSWVMTETLVQATSGEDFCTTCHGMAPFAESYRQDIHGGNNTKGLMAACVACHLPHDAPSHMLIAKAGTGIHDAWTQLLSVLWEPDWIGNLERRGEFVFDSGCLTCHANLAKATNPTPTAALSHQSYFASQDRMQCVTCHTQVGHKDLLTHLPAAPVADKRPQTVKEIITQ